MGEDRERGGVGTLPQAQQRVANLACRVQLRLCDIIPPQPKQDRNELWGLAHLLTQRVCLSVGVLHLGRGVPFGHQQRRTEGNVEGQDLLELRRRLWQGLEQLNPSGEVAYGFHIGRAVAGLLACPLPVGHRLLVAARRGVVMCQQFGLCRNDLRKSGFQHLGNALVVVLARTLQQRLIGDILDQCVFEEVGGLRRHASLIEEFGCDEALEFALQRLLIELSDGYKGLQEGIGEVPPQRGAQLGETLCGHQPTRRAMRESCKVAGIATAEPGPARTCSLLSRGEEIGFQHRLGHFFDKQRDAIAFLHEVLHNLSRERVAPVTRSARSSTIWATWVRGSRLKRHLRHVGTTAPRRLKLGPTGRQQTERGCGHLVYHKTEPLNGGRIDPVEVFHDQQGRVCGGLL